MGPVLSISSLRKEGTVQVKLGTEWPLACFSETTRVLVLLSIVMTSRELTLCHVVTPHAGFRSAYECALEISHRVRDWRVWCLFRDSMHILYFTHAVRYLRGRKMCHANMRCELQIVRCFAERIQLLGNCHSISVLVSLGEFFSKDNLINEINYMHDANKWLSAE